MNMDPVSFPEHQMIAETNPVIALGMLHLVMIGVANLEVICA